MMICFVAQPQASYATATESAPNRELQARSALVMDAVSGRVLFSKSEHDALPPASITKVMTMLLLMEAIERGDIKWTDLIRTSEHAASMGGSQIFLQPGEEMSVEDLLKGIAMASGNDASVAVAERLAGSEADFVKRMNERAQQLGMKDTVFKNTNGLPVDGHLSSAYDIAIMSRALLSHAKITQFTGKYEDHLRQSSKNPFWLVNTNKLVRFYPGADGLKTGFTNEAKYCLTATAQKNGMRLIVVVMGEPDPKTRNAEVMQLFDEMFQKYEPLTLYKKGQELASVSLNHAVPERIAVQAPQDIVILQKRGTKQVQGEWQTRVDWQQPLAFPISKQTQIATLVLLHNQKEIARFPLLATQDYAQAGWLDFWSRTIQRMIEPK